MASRRGKFRPTPSSREWAKRRHWTHRSPNPPSPVTAEQLAFLAQWGVTWTPPNQKAAENCINQIKKSNRYQRSTRHVNPGVGTLARADSSIGKELQPRFADDPSPRDCRTPDRNHEQLDAGNMLSRSS